MVIAVILVTYFIDHVLDKKYPWIWAFVALRLRVWNLLFNLFILRHADYRYMDISLPIVLFCFFLFKFTQSRNPVDAATIRRRGERFLTSKSGRGHGVFHSKGDRPRGGTGRSTNTALPITIYTITSTLELLLGQFLGDLHLLHLSVLRRGVPRLRAPALLPDDVRRVPGRARLLAPPLPALGAGGPRHPAHPAPQQTSICRKTRGR